MSSVPPHGFNDPGDARRAAAARDAHLEPEIEMDLGLSSPSAGSEVGSGIGATGMWAPDALLVEHRSLWGEIWRRFRRDKFAMIGVVVIIILVLVAVLAPWIAPHDPTKQYDEGLTMQGMPVGPSSQFWLGTDTLGRDLLSRLMYGARVSLVVGVCANGFALILGVIFGLTAGYFRGGTETLLMRMTDVMMAFPIYLLAVALVSVLKPSIGIIILVIGIVYWTPMTRVIHGEVLSIREKEFVDAARLTGCTNRRILFRHILPHLVAPIVYTSLGIATTILFEATLSYIGLGVQPPTPSWGQMISEGQAYYLSAPHLVIYPGLCIMVTVLAFNLVGDGLRDAFDPRQRRR
jgi:peptide/nickel transport system permease protein